MIRTQVQLPEAMYRDLKRLAEEREWSLAEAIRRGAELLLRSYPEIRDPVDVWELPEAVPLGEFQAPAEDWRQLANERVAP